jgi:hypothetical protein
MSAWNGQMAIVVPARSRLSPDGSGLAEILAEHRLAVPANQSFLEQGKSLNGRPRSG